MVLRNFRFLLKDKLAGMGHPGYRDTLPEALAELRRKGIGAIVSLDEEGLPDDLVAEHGFIYRHYPIEDFRAPSLQQAQAFVQFVDQQLAEGRAVVAHCWAGIGRTGTMLACYLVHRGQSLAEAERRVARFGGIETREQREFVRRFEESCRGKHSDRSKPDDSLTDETGAPDQDEESPDDFT
ncbi:dual specificity protein phosphatase family protein [Candidatus Sumerlaeota bacterium]|nr:dual specificity protein phosphatase family protein [Candidatus Sumerlaeota bacterium]